MENAAKLEQYVLVEDPSKRWVTERLVKKLGDEGMVPSFSEAALKLCALARNENSSMEDFARVIALDPGLVTRCIQVASSVGFAARPIDSIEQALMMIGIREIRRIAFAVGTIDTFGHFKIKVDWKRFWLHNILVARLTEKVGACFREPTGIEYLSGLLHDIGKLVIEHSFPQEFENVLSVAAERQCSHAPIEKELLGLDHTQIGAAVCECLELNSQVIRAVLFHHDPLNPCHTSDSLADGGFLAACIAVADRLANIGSTYLPDVKTLNPPVEKSAEWFFLSQFATEKPFDVDLKAEIERAEQDLNAFSTK